MINLNIVVYLDLQMNSQEVDIVREEMTPMSTKKTDKIESDCEAGCKECLKITLLCCICSCIWNRQ